jgi:hypothetical protein
MDMHAIAAELDMHYDTFRKRRHDLTKNEGFPAPFTVFGSPKWDRDAVLAWKLRRTQQPPVTVSTTRDKADLLRRLGDAA